MKRERWGPADDTVAVVVKKVEGVLEVWNDDLPLTIVEDLVDHRRRYTHTYTHQLIVSYVGPPSPRRC